MKITWHLILQKVKTNELPDSPIFRALVDCLAFHTNGTSEEGDYRLAIV